ncbi:nuclease-related domain-containing protein [Ornithinimicrobium sp. W1679]|uniref:nuclease-related domain-containing protein n=1 Tax=Ornithinimicrobium sp. W1679 TaxID=3418770 RepID=UPI003CF4B94A
MRALYDPGTKTVSCLVCDVSDTEGSGRQDDDLTSGGSTGGGEQERPPDRDPGLKDDPATGETSPGVAGSSARREHERRVAAREDRIRTRHPRLGGLILAVSDDPQTTKSWATGAVGEERLGRRLDAAANPLVRVLHDRGIPGSRANLDHLVVCPTGVFVVDAKRYRGRPHRVVEGGLFTPRTEKLLVDRRDCTRLVEAGLRQAGLVREALSDDTVEVRSVLCFVEADWPLLGGDFVIRDVCVSSPRRLVSTLARPGPLTEEHIHALYQRLATAFPAA